MDDNLIDAFHLIDRSFRETAMEDNVVTLPLPHIDLSPDHVLTEAAKADLDTVLVIGMDREGNPYFASSTGYKPDNLWHLEMAKLFITSV